MDYTILVNKDCPLPNTYLNENLVSVDSKYKDNILLDSKVYEQFKKLQSDALKHNYHIDIMSGYRSYEYQDKIYHKLLNEKGFNYAFRSVAKPGYSEHQTGFSLDICIYRDDLCYIEHDIIDLIETKWLHLNASKYGFIVRYPLDKEGITKYNYEPWHLRYVGDIANYLYNNDITLEEYYEKHI